MADFEKLAKLKQQDWDTILSKLTLHAAGKLHRLKWNKSRVPAGLKPDDIACEAITAVWTGDRAWDFEGKPDILIHLKSVVNSLISHLVESQDHKRQDDIERDAEQDETIFDPPDQSMPTPYDELVAKDIFEKLWTMVKSDEDAELVLCCIESGISKPADIKVETGMSIEQIYKAKKKIGDFLRVFEGEKNEKK
ncbi:hypothetical protein F9K33_10910 [bacterium]|nr:MAG: hypothetical protein F9K33_10910 [bacterium]